MRIIAGKHKGRVLAEFQGSDIRPTSDRVKESLFNILAYSLVGARVLDLFCGSGNLGIEAISRGALDVVFNDASKASIDVMKKNLAKINENATIYQSNYLTLLSNGIKPFDVIFIDPPYATNYGKIALEKISANGLLTNKGIAIFESNRAFDGVIDGLEMYDERKYGKTFLSFFKKMTKEE